MMRKNRPEPLRSIDWIGLFPWLHIIRCFRIALQIRMMFFAAVGVILCAIGWSAIYYCFDGEYVFDRGGDVFRTSETMQCDLASKTKTPPSLKSRFTKTLQQSQQTLFSATRTIYVAPNELKELGYDGAAVAHGKLLEKKKLHSIRRITNFLQLPQGIADELKPTSSELSPPPAKVTVIISTFYQRFFHANSWQHSWKYKRHLLSYYGLSLLWFLLVWGVCGGAIVRGAALQLCTDEKISIGRMFGFGLKKCVSMFFSMAIPLILLAVMAAGIGCTGGVLDWLGLQALQAITWPVLLLVGLMMALLWLGLLFAWPLMFGAIGVENSDAFDAVSRAYSYIYQRPIHYIFYRLFAMIVCFVGLVMVKVVCVMAVKLTVWSVCVTSNTYCDTSTYCADSQDWNVLLLTVPSIFVASFYWVAAVAIYLQLRKDTDRAELDQITIEPEYVTGAELSPITTDERGAPAMANGGDQSEESTKLDKLDQLGKSDESEQQLP